MTAKKLSDKLLTKLRDLSEKPDGWGDIRMIEPADARAILAALPSDAAQAPQPTRYFVHDNDCGYEEFDTDEERAKAHQAAIEGYLDDGWSEEVTSVVSGIVTHRTVQTDVEHRPPRCAEHPEQDNDDCDVCVAWGEFPNHDFETCCRYEPALIAAPVAPAAVAQPDANRYFEEWWAAERHFGGDSRDYALRGFNAALAMRSRATTPQACKLHHEDWRELYNEAYERSSFESFHKRALELITENEQSSAALPQAGANAQLLEDAIAHLNGLLDLCEQGSKAERREARSAIHAFHRRALIAANPADKTYFDVNTELSTETVDKPVQRMSEAERDVLTERARQVTEEGWTPIHDDHNDLGQLASAAACYAITHRWTRIDSPPPQWPGDWARAWWKPTTPRRDLVKAGALIIAEIERIDRLGMGQEAA